MSRYRIEIIEDSKKLHYLNLLFIADENIKMIYKYLFKGTMVGLFNKNLLSLAIVTLEGPYIYEIKNIVVPIKYHHLGYGSKMINIILKYYKNYAKEIYVGTGDSILTTSFYKKCGFKYSHSIEDFFIDNYKEPIIEDGKTLKDMVYFKYTY